MKISYKWLRELTGLDWSPEEMGERLTLSGTACEDIEPTARYLDKVVVGTVTDLQPVAGADKIRLATVDIGADQLAVICGAPNVAVGQKVAVATIGARLAGDFKIKKAKIRGVESSGMICSERELGLSDDHSGIIELPTDAPVGTPLVDYLDYDDYILTFELTPNRPDSTSAIGLARDLAALGKVAVKRPQFELTESETSAADFIRIRIDDPEACPRYAARVIRGVTIAESPWWLQKKLITAGIRPISNVVDIGNYVMLECGHPLHAFDLDRFGSDEVVVRRARDGEMFSTLDGNEHKLNSSVLMITNGKACVAAGGIMGGLNSEVSNDTTNILLEAAYFNPSVIRKGRKVLTLSTDSSYRFERGCDPNGVEHALDRAAFLLGEICGGEICRGIVDCYPKRIDPKKIDYRPERCNAILGKTVERDRMTEIFVALELEVKPGDVWEVTAPTFRPDLEREIDLIEEIVRIEGWESVDDAITNIGPLFTRVHPEDRFRATVRRILTGVGFDEMKGHGLSNARQAALLDPDLPQVRLANSLSEELNIMRNSLIHTGLAVVSHNLAHRNLDLSLFEIGKRYLPDGNDGFAEDERLCLVVTGQTAGDWRDKPRAFDFYDLTGALEALSEHYRWAGITMKAAPQPFTDPDQSFDILLDSAVIGWVGRISDRVLSKFDIKQPVLAAELALAPLAEAVSPLNFFEPLPIYPAAPRDLAVVVDEHIHAQDIIYAVKDAAGPLAEEVGIFDLYKGKQIANGKKSIAIAIRYRSREGSLASEEVDACQVKVVEKLKNNFNAEIRDR